MASLIKNPRQWVNDTVNAVRRDVRNAGEYVEGALTDPAQLIVGPAVTLGYDVGAAGYNKYIEANTPGAPPVPVIPEPPDPNDAAIENAANEERKRRGRASTILTGGRGLLGAEPRQSARRTLLGV